MDACETITKFDYALDNNLKSLSANYGSKRDPGFAIASKLSRCPKANFDNMWNIPAAAVCTNHMLF